MLNNARVVLPVTSNGSAGAPSHRMAVALGYARGRLQWLRPGARRQSRLAVSAVAGANADDRMAREHLAHGAARDQLLRQPWIVRETAVEGGHHLRSAKAAGRGVILSYCHFGPFPAIGVTALTLVGDVHQVAGAWLAAPRPDFITPRVRRWRRLFDEAGVPLISADGCFPVVSELLRRGAVVVMAFDWPDRSTHAFLAGRFASLPAPRVWPRRAVPCRTGDAAVPSICGSVRRSARHSRARHPAAGASCTTRSRRGTSNGYSSVPPLSRIRAASARGKKLLPQSHGACQSGCADASAGANAFHVRPG